MSEWLPVDHTTDANVAQAFTFYPGSSGLTGLDEEASKFENYVLESCSYTSYPIAAANSEGQYALAIDADVTELATTFSGTIRIFPQRVIKIDKPCTLRVRTNQVMKGKLHFNNHGQVRSNLGPTHALTFASTTAGNLLPRILCSYTVTFTNRRGYADPDYIVTSDGTNWIDPAGEKITKVPTYKGTRVGLSSSLSPTNLWDAFKKTLSEWSDAYTVDDLATIARHVGNYIASDSLVLPVTAAAGSSILLPRRLVNRA